MGFIGISSDVVNIARCLLVNATYGPEKYFQSPAAATKGGLVPPPTARTPDHPRARSWYRWVSTFLGLAYWGAIAPEIVANWNYSNVFDSQATADSTARARLVVFIIIVFSFDLKTNYLVL